MNSHFSKSVRTKLAKQGISIGLGIACPAFEGDKYFSGTSYALIKENCQYMRNYNEVIKIANGTLSL